MPARDFECAVAPEVEVQCVHDVLLARLRRVSTHLEFILMG